MILLKKNNWYTLCLYFLLLTSPILFGARHPLIQGLYTFLIFIFSGTWLVVNFTEAKAALLRTINIPPAILLIGIFISSLSLPIYVLQLLSPVRAEYLETARLIAQLAEPVTSLSYYAPQTFLYFCYLLSIFFYFHCSSRLFRGKEILIAALWIITGVGALEAVYGLVQALVPSIGILWLPSNISAEGTARGTIIYRNQFAGFMNLCWPAAMMLGLILYKPVMDKIQFRTRMKNKLTLSEKINAVFQKATLPFWASLFMMLSVIFSRSRGGIIVMILVAAMLLFILPFSRRFKTAGATFFLLLITLYGGMIGFQSVIDRFRFFYEGAQQRLSLWTDSLTILQDHFLTGIGMGAYKFLSPIYLHDVPNSTWYDFAHNEYIELALEVGAPLMAVFLALLLWGMTSFFRRIRRVSKNRRELIDTEDKKILAIGCYCALTGFLLHGLVDFTWRLPVNVIYAVTLLAILNSTMPDEQVNK